MPRAPGSRQTSKPLDPTRRRLLAAAIAGPVLAVAQRVLAKADRLRVVRLAAARQALVGQGRPGTAVWAYNGGVPGPELRFR